MTDKQIIIDVCPYQGECSVSGCKRNDDGCFVRQLFEERYRAENQIVELNKTIQAKEQECKNNKTAYQIELDIYNQECLNLQEELKETLEQLERKEQECETLASQLDFEVQKKECLEQECKEYKEQLDEMILQSALLPKFFGLSAEEITQLATKCSQLKQTLTEIKEIAEHCIKQDICTLCDNSEKCHIEDEEIPTYDVCKLILQKISKCEVE